MWMDEELNDAMSLLLGSDSVEKAWSGDAPYIVIDGVSYTDGLYQEALNKLLQEKQLQLVERNNDREKYKAIHRSGDTQT